MTLDLLTVSVATLPNIRYKILCINPWGITIENMRKDKKKYTLTEELLNKQDKKSKREINDENYIDAEWCMSRLKGCCGQCGCKFEIDRDKGQISSNFTAQRLCNLHGHTKDNCDSWCVYCNWSAK